MSMKKKDNQKLYQQQLNHKQDLVRGNKFPGISQKKQNQDRKNSLHDQLQDQQSRNNNRESTNEEEMNCEDGQKTSTDPYIYNNLDYYQNSSTKENCSVENDDCTKPLYGHQGFPAEDLKQQQQQQENINNNSNNQIEENNNNNSFINKTEESNNLNMWPYSSQNNLNNNNNNGNNNHNSINFLELNNSINNNNSNNNNSQFNGKYNGGTFNQLLGMNSNGYYEGDYNSSGNLMGLQNQGEQPVFTIQDDLSRGDLGERNYDVKIEQNYEDPNTLPGVRRYKQLNSNGNVSLNPNINGNGNMNQMWSVTSQLNGQNHNDLQNTYMMEDNNQQQFQYAQGQPQQQQPQTQQNGYFNGNSQLQNQNPLFMQYNLNEPQQFGNGGYVNNNNNNNINNNFQNQQQQLFYNNNNQQQQQMNQNNNNNQNVQEKKLKGKDISQTTSSGNVQSNIDTSENQYSSQHSKSHKQQQQQQQQQQQFKKPHYKQEYNTQSSSFDQDQQDYSKQQQSKMLNKKIKKEKQGYHKEYQKIDHNRQTCPSEYCKKYREKGVNTQSDKCPVYQKKLRSQKQQNSQRQRDDEKSYMAKFVIYTQALISKLRNKGVEVENEEEVKELKEMGENIVQRKKYQESVEKERKKYIRAHGPVNLMNMSQFLLLIFFLAVSINSVVYVGVFEATQYPIRLNNRNLEEEEPNLGKYLDNYYFCRCYSQNCSELDFLRDSQQDTQMGKNQNQYVQDSETKFSECDNDDSQNSIFKNKRKNQNSFYDNKTVSSEQQSTSASSDIPQNQKVENRGLNTCALIKIQKKNQINSMIFKMKNNIQETKKLWSEKKHKKLVQNEQ